MPLCSLFHLTKSERGKGKIWGRMAKGKEQKGEREEDKEGKAWNTGVQVKELCL